jgi:hypothetical protein
MLTSHVHYDQDMEVVAVHPALPGGRTPAKNEHSLRTYRCACGSSFDPHTTIHVPNVAFPPGLIS